VQVSCEFYRIVGTGKLLATGDQLLSCLNKRAPTCMATTRKQFLETEDLERRRTRRIRSIVESYGRSEHSVAFSTDVAVYDVIANTLYINVVRPDSGSFDFVYTSCILLVESPKFITLVMQRERLRVSEANGPCIYYLVRV